MNQDKALHELIDFLLSKIEYHQDQAKYYQSQATFLLQEADNHSIGIEKKLAEVANFLIKAADHFEKLNLYQEVKARAEKFIPTNNEAQK